MNASKDPNGRLSAVGERSVMVDRIPSPVGDIVIAVRDNALVLLDFVDNEDRIERLLRNIEPAGKLHDTVDPTGVSTKVDRYFSGELGALDDIVVDAHGTPFQRLVWAGLRAIPAGTTTTYGRLASQVGHPTASRAVGAANGANPIGIVVPCHRVIGANGTLTGYAGGLDRKIWLLRHEGALL
jgi:methylated-DNA-[protein]-cysteine S-methyltransferase